MVGPLRWLLIRREIMLPCKMDLDAAEGTSSLESLSISLCGSVIVVLKRHCVNINGKF